MVTLKITFMAMVIAAVAALDFGAMEKKEEAHSTLQLSDLDLHLKLATLIEEVDDMSQKNEIFYSQMKPKDIEYAEDMAEIKTITETNLDALRELHLVQNQAKAQDYAFSAFASESSSYNNGAKLRYDAVITNIGNAFDNSTYTFNCNIRGYYMFSFAVYTDDRGMRASLLRDGFRMCTTYAYGSSEAGATDEVDQGSNSCSFFCEAGQVVHVEAFGDGNFLTGGANRHSTFSGFMIEALV